MNKRTAPAEPAPASAQPAEHARSAGKQTFGATLECGPDIVRLLHALAGAFVSSVATPANVTLDFAAATGLVASVEYTARTAVLQLRVPRACFARWHPAADGAFSACFAGPDAVKSWAMPSLGGGGKRATPLAFTVRSEAVAWGEAPSHAWFAYHDAAHDVTRGRVYGATGAEHRMNLLSAAAAGDADDTLFAPPPAEPALDEQCLVFSMAAADFTGIVEYMNRKEAAHVGVGAIAPTPGEGVAAAAVPETTTEFRGYIEAGGNTEHDIVTVPVTEHRVGGAPRLYVYSMLLLRPALALLAAAGADTVRVCARPAMLHVHAACGRSAGLVGSCVDVYVMPPLDLSPFGL